MSNSLAVNSHLVDHYLDLAAQMLDEAEGPERAQWIKWGDEEHPNLQAVFAWLIAHEEADRGLRLAYLLQELWFEDHHTSEARELLATLLALPIASAQMQTRALCLDLAGAFALAQNDFVEARKLTTEAVTICRELGHRAMLGSRLLHLGHVERYAGDHSAAQNIYQEALEIFLDLSDQWGIAIATNNLSSVAVDVGDYIAADQLVKESLQKNQALDLEWEIALTLGNAAGVAAGLGQPERAMRLAGASTAHRERIGVSLPPLHRARFERMIMSARQALAESIQKTLWDEGAAMTLEQAVAYALNDSLV